MELLGCRPLTLVSADSLSSAGASFMLLLLSIFGPLGCLYHSRGRYLSPPLMQSSIVPHLYVKL